MVDLPVVNERFYHAQTNCLPVSLSYCAFSYLWRVVGVRFGLVELSLGQAGEDIFRDPRV